MNWAIDEMRVKRKEWRLLFNLCLKYKQFDLLNEYWKEIDKMEKEEEE